MTKTIQRTIACVVLFALTSLFATAQPTAKKSSDSSQTKKLILELEKQGREATLKNDVEANDHLLADNWLNINPDGSVTTKAQLMELLKAGTFKISSIENDEVLVRVYRGTAIVTGRSTTRRAGQGEEIISRQVRFTRVYARPRGHWQVVSAHNSLIR
jgi:hypothetical protein